MGDVGDSIAEAVDLAAESRLNTVIAACVATTSARSPLRRLSATSASTTAT